MSYLNRLSFTLLLTLSFAGYVNSQTKPSKGFIPPPPTAVPITGASVEAGVFESKTGGFSIAISQLPLQTLERGTDKGRAKGLDLGRQYLWKFEKTFYTAFYCPPLDFDGNPMPQVYADMQSGTRKGIANGGARLTSEKRIKLGEYPGTEFRYTSHEGVKFINRTYIVGDIGYSIMGGYIEEKYESEVLRVLDSFKLSKKQVSPTIVSLPTRDYLNQWGRAYNCDDSHTRYRIHELPGRRPEVQGGLYHIITRDVDRRDIFSFGGRLPEISFAARVRSCVHATDHCT
jgi:hypothetical protein